MDRTVSDVPTLSSIEEIGLDMFDAEAISRPHRFYALLRERAPIVWSEQTRAWVLTRYEDVKRVNTHARVCSDQTIGARSRRRA